MNTNINRARVDDQVSPQAAVIVKPVDNVSIYTRLQRLLSAGVGRPVQRADRRDPDSRSAEIREQGSRHQVEHRSEAAVLGGGVQARPHQPADRRPQQSRLFLSVRQQATRGFESQPQRLGHRATGSRRWDMPIRMRASRARPRRRSFPAIACSSCPTTSSPGGTNTSSTDMGGGYWHHLFRRFLRVIATIPSGCRASCASMPASTPRSTRTGRRSSRSKTSSTRATGRPPTATTTSRRARDAPCA